MLHNATAIAVPNPFFMYNACNDIVHVFTPAAAVESQRGPPHLYIFVDDEKGKDYVSVTYLVVSV